MSHASFWDGTKIVTVSPDNPLPVAGGGGGSGPSTVAVSNFPATQAVTGPLTNLQLVSITDTAANAAVTDPAVSATMIGLLKGILTALNTIAANTAPTP